MLHLTYKILGFSYGNRQLLNKSVLYGVGGSLEEVLGSKEDAPDSGHGVLGFFKDPFSS